MFSFDKLNVHEDLGLPPYKCFINALSGGLAPTPNTIQITGQWTEIQGQMQIKRDQVVVECRDASTNDTLFRDAFAGILDKARTPEPKSGSWNIALLVLDSVSRSQFARHMPRTLKFFVDQNAAIMKGYSAVGPTLFRIQHSLSSSDFTKIRW
jgi:hypothetical protein